MLHTERLTLRELIPSDLDDIHELLSLPETDEFNTLGIPETIEVSGELLANWLMGQQQEPRTSYVFGMIKKDDRFIGLIALNLGKPKYRTAEIWFKVHKDHWRNGYTTEALCRLLDFSFNTLNLHRVEAGCATENIASARVLEKAGMIREGMKRKKLPIRGEWKDNYFYGILETEYGMK